MGLSNTKLRGEPTSWSARDLARAIAYLSVAIRRIVESGPKAWASVDRLFPPDEGEAPKTAAPEEFSGIPMEMEAELDLIVAYIIGDHMLDLLAYAELVRRDRVPEWNAGTDPVPAMWPALMAVLEEGPLDAMGAAARYLDVTLAVARDVLVAHRDPEAVELPSYSSLGSVSLHRPVLDDERRKVAESLVHELNRSLDRPWPDEWSGTHLVDTIIAVPQQLTPDVRRGLRRVYRLAGFESPQLVTILDKAMKLIRAYRVAVEPPTETADE
jgi:hypothetical protein